LEFLNGIFTQSKERIIMSDELNNRRNFIKRASVSAAVLAGSVVTVAATTEQDRGSGSQTGNGVVVGRSNKKEILYKKTAAWEEFFAAAK
jgi:hypothetical protein